MSEAASRARFHSAARRLERRVRPHSLRRKKGTPLNGGQFLLEGFFGDGCVIGGLPAQPPPITQAEVAAKSKVGVSRDSALARDDFTNSLRRNSDVLGEAVLRQAKRLEELFVEHLAGRYR